VTERPLLDGVRVLDLTTALAGPYCTMVLADLGADVISVEPVDGDSMRRRRSTLDGIDYPFQVIHHDKRSIGVDLRDERGAAIVRSLAASCDVLVENFRPGVLAKYGLDATSLRSLVPSLVYCSISGYGQTGPLCREGGVDLVAQGHAGLLSVTGHPGGEPVKAGFPVSDVGAGMWAAIGVLGALTRRHVTGEGATIDVALNDGLLAWAVWEVADYQMTGAVPGPLGSAHRLTAPYEAFECGDGRWLVLAGVASRWRVLCAVLGAPELVDDPRFASESERYANRVELAAVLQDRFRGRSRREWIDCLRAAGVPAGPVNSISEAMDDEQFNARDMWRRPEGADVVVINTPLKADGIPGVRRRAPLVGEHTERVLGDLGFDDRTIEALAYAGVVASSPAPPE
jgi:crotonobetainyl-CoA:carnitine CoA-transferase CaiB-like acyl-CoA transferase